MSEMSIIPINPLQPFPNHCVYHQVIDLCQQLATLVHPMTGFEGAAVVATCLAHYNSLLPEPYG